MKAVILAGGLGTRISEESNVRPKPMIEIGGRPILWHIMKIYAAHGVNDFIVCCGYKGYVIKEYFANYFLHMSDVTFDMEHNRMEVHRAKAEPWRVTVVDTGDETMTGGRLKRVRDYVGTEDFCFTYGDGVSDVNVKELIRFHRQGGALATLTAVQPPGRFGALDLNEAAIRGFKEKPMGDGGWINGGFFVLSPAVFDYIEGDATSWEAAPLERLAAEGKLNAYKHAGFWQAMDTLRDKNHLEDLWKIGQGAVEGVGLVKIHATAIAGVFEVEVEPFQDHRGAFARLYCERELASVVGARSIVQINHSLTRTVGAIRGLHYQRPPHAEMKIVRALRGRVFDVAVDLRKASPTFLRWVSCELSPEGRRALVVPEGCAHGFQVLEPDSELLYLHTAFYTREVEAAVRFDDPRVAVAWPLPPADLSERDRAHPLLTPDFTGIET